MIFEIHKEQTIGMIIQVGIGYRIQKHDSESVVVQSCGIALENSIKCTTNPELIVVLKQRRYRIIYIYRISSFYVDELLYTEMRKTAMLGTNIFLFTDYEYKLWYSDVFYKSSAIEKTNIHSQDSLYGN